MCFVAELTFFSVAHISHARNSALFRNVHNLHIHIVATLCGQRDTHKMMMLKKIVRMMTMIMMMMMMTKQCEPKPGVQEKSLLLPNQDEVSRAYAHLPL